MKAISCGALALLIFWIGAPKAGIVDAAAEVSMFTETGFAVNNDSQSNFLTEFNRYGGVNALGYPSSSPYESGGFRYQAFQRAILQWRPELGRALLANTLDWLSDQGKDAWLDSQGVPWPLKDSGGSWNQVAAEREGWLTQPSIAQTYRAGGGMERFGLPQSRPERRGPFVVQRFQRIVFQLWVDQVPGMPAPGSVVGVLAGDLAKQSGLVPATAPATSGGTGASFVDSADAEQVALSLINQTRASNGLGPVAMDGSLQSEARAYALEMAQRDFFGHTDPDGLTFLGRLQSSGVANWSIGLENLGWGQGYKTPSDSIRANHQSMMAEVPPDDGHKRNILNGQAHRVGIGVVQRASDGKVYYACDFTD